MKYYVAVDIGCIECGEDSHILGVFDSKETAEKVLSDHEDRQAEYWHGEHRFYVHGIELNKEYPVEYRHEWEMEE